MKRMRHWVEYLALRALIALIDALPDRVAEGIGATLGRLGYWPFRIRRAVAEDNVRRAFPEWGEAKVQEVVRASYEHLGRELVVILRMPTKSKQQIIAMTNCDGLPEADAAFREGRGMVVVAGHFGNWEIGAAMMAARGYPLDAIVNRQTNPLFDAYIVRTREELGVHIIARERARYEALRSLQSGRAVAFASDQNAGRSGLFVPFFGRLAATHRGAARMAYRAGVPMWLALPFRQPDGTYLLRLREVPFSREGEEDDVVYRGMAAFSAMLEAGIRERPEQYLWQHRRWKTRPPEERQRAKG